jgi:hypothetical protein
VALPRLSVAYDRRIIRLPSGKVIMSTCGLTLVHFKLRSAAAWIVVEVTDVADDHHVLHRPHMVEGHDVLVACGGDDIGGRCGIFEGDDFKAVHRRLQGADRIDLVTLTRARRPSAS